MTRLLIISNLVSCVVTTLLVACMWARNRPPAVSGIIKSYTSPHLPSRSLQEVVDIPDCCQCLVASSDPSFVPSALTVTFTPSEVPSKAPSEVPSEVPSEDPDTTFPTFDPINDPADTLTVPSLSPSKSECSNVPNTESCPIANGANLCCDKDDLDCCPNIGVCCKKERTNCCTEAGFIAFQLCVVTCALETATSNLGDD